MGQIWGQQAPRLDRPCRRRPQGRLGRGERCTAPTLALSSPTLLEGGAREACIVTGGTSQRASLTRAAANAHRSGRHCLLPGLPSVRVPGSRELLPLEQPRPDTRGCTGTSGHGAQYKPVLRCTDRWPATYHPWTALRVRLQRRGQRRTAPKHKTNPSPCQPESTMKTKPAAGGKHTAALALFSPSCPHWPRDRTEQGSTKSTLPRRARLGHRCEPRGTSSRSPQTPEHSRHAHSTSTPDKQKSLRGMRIRPLHLTSRKAYEASRLVSFTSDSKAMATRTDSLHPLSVIAPRKLADQEGEAATCGGCTEADTESGKKTKQNKRVHTTTAQVRNHCSGSLGQVHTVCCSSGPGLPNKDKI